MFYIRTTKTASGARAVQIVQYQSRKTIIIQHLGSTHDEQELAVLKQTAREWVETIHPTTTGASFIKNHDDLSEKVTS